MGVPSITFHEKSVQWEQHGADGYTDGRNGGNMRFSLLCECA